jgi:hypothetical protein
VAPGRTPGNHTMSQARSPQAGAQAHAPFELPGPPALLRLRAHLPAPGQYAAPAGVCQSLGASRLPGPCAATAGGLPVDMHACKGKGGRRSGQVLSRALGLGKAPRPALAERTVALRAVCPSPRAQTGAAATSARRRGARGSRARGPQRGGAHRSAVLRRGEARRGEARRGEARRGAARRGEARRGEARRGEARRGEARRGEARRGEARRGDARRERARPKACMACAQGHAAGRPPPATPFCGAAPRCSRAPQAHPPASAAPSPPRPPRCGGRTRGQ